MSKSNYEYPRPIYRMRIKEYASDRSSRLEVDEIKVVYENPLSIVIEDYDNTLITIDRDADEILDYTINDLSKLLEPPYEFLILATGMESLYFNEDVSLHPDWKDVSTKILLHSHLDTICRKVGVRSVCPLTPAQIEGSCQRDIIKIRNIIGCDTERAVNFIEEIREMVHDMPMSNLSQAIIFSLNRFTFSTTIIEKEEPSTQSFDPTPDTQGCINEELPDDIC